MLTKCARLFYSDHVIVVWNASRASCTCVTARVPARAPWSALDLIMWYGDAHILSHTALTHSLTHSRTLAGDFEGYICYSIQKRGGVLFLQLVTVRKHIFCSANCIRNSFALRGSNLYLLESGIFSPVDTVGRKMVSKFKPAALHIVILLKLYWFKCPLPTFS